MKTPRLGYFLESYVSSIDDSDQPFAVWVPPSYSPRRKYPLVVALHGMDADHRMIPEECFEIPQRGFRDDVILICPFGRGDINYQGPGEADLWDTINWIKSRYLIDSRRQYLTGLSMGGFAAWRLATEYPDQWAAIAPICGGGDIRFVANLKKIPVWCVHGELDDLVPVEHSRQLVNELTRRKFHHRYDELKGWGHNSWEWLYRPDRGSDSLIDWFLQFRRAKPAPAITQPARQSTFADLFQERLVISYPSQTLISREAELLRAWADRIARFSFGDHLMRTGRFLTRADHELTPADLSRSNHLMLGRVENNLWMKKVERKLTARHVRGQLNLGGETYLGKSLVAATVQKSPWNPDRLLGVITYQQFQQMRGLESTFCGIESQAQRLNLYDTQQKRFIRQEL
ncbi:MAG: dienelactone hydrolase family protein [Opitutaceae bacterium]|nr:dienelactone hydrolase family protein [Verrucomicrobiales bacterium]